MGGTGNAASLAHLEENKGTGYDCTNHELPREIAVEPSLGQASSTIANSSIYLQRTFGLSQQEAMEWFNNTAERVEIDREFQRLNASTKVKIKIRPKNSKIINNFIYIEDIPKACLTYLSGYEIENNGEVISADPLIVWHFAAIEERQEASYIINDAELESRCKDLIQGVGLAENFVDSKEEVHNRPPVLSIPDISFSEDTTYSADMSPYVADPDNLKKEIRLTASSATNMNIVLDGYALQIIPHANWNSMEKITFSASDATNVTSQTVSITITPVDDPPVITSEPRKQVAQYQQYTYQVQATDIENDPLSFSLGQHPVGMSIDSQGIISWPPQRAGSYPVKVQVSEASGLTVAQEYTLEVQRVNKAPQFAPLPSAKLKGLGTNDNGHRDNVITNLWVFVSDDSDTKNLEYSVSSQSNPDLVSCFVDNQKNLDCDVKNNYDGYSDVTISVSDGQFNSYAVSRINVEKNLCTPNLLRKCEDSKIYWFDSCDIKGSLYYDCRNNWLRNQCHDGKCCIGTAFCQEPTQSCKDECKPEERQCSGTGYRVCGDFNNDGCFEWSSVTSCGPDHCDEFRSWTCKDSKTRERSRTCYKQVCANGNCDSALWQDTQTEACSANQVCQNGNCVSQTCSDGTPVNSCSATRPTYCNSAGQLVNNCATCGCPAGKVCQGDGSCVNAVSSLSASYTITSIQDLGGGFKRYNYDITLTESAGVNVNIQSTYSLCSSLYGCVSGTSTFGLITGGTSATRSGYFDTTLGDTVTSTYSWNDVNSNSGTVSRAMSAP